MWFGFPSTSATQSTAGFGSGFATGATTGFGTSIGTTTASGFGTSTGTTTATGFGTGLGTITNTGFGSTGFVSNGFGLGLTSTAFCAKPATTTAFGSFGNQQAVLPQPVSSLVVIGQAVSLPQIYGDERDAIIAKWNQLLAFWGTGKGYFNNAGQYADFTPENPFSMFKAVGYNCIPVANNEDGLVALTFAKSEMDVCNNQVRIVEELHRILGNNVNLIVCVDSVKPLPEDKCEMVIFIQNHTAAGNTSKLLASDVFTHLNQQNVKQQLHQQLTIQSIHPKIALTPDQLKLYLEHPPSGIDQRIWQQAKLDNPDPERMIPVPMVGFKELQSRLKHQEQQTIRHQSRLDMIAQDIARLQHNHTDMIAKTEQYKRNQLQLGHRVLQMLVKQEISRKCGYAIQADEEQLRAKLEAIIAELNAPTKFKGRLNELMSQMRMQNQLGVCRPDVGYQMDSSVQLEVKEHLKQQQEGLRLLIGIIREDMDELKMIEQGLCDDNKLRR